VTQRDTFIAYVRGFLRRHPARALRLVRLLPMLVRFFVQRAHRGELKAAVLAAVLDGSSRAEIDAWTMQFVAELVAHGLHADAVAAIALHRRQGDALTLLSASPDLYVPAIGAALGFSEVVCTGLEWRDGRLTGALTTANRRGAEKARWLAELRRRQPRSKITAYGNSSADLEHLRLADRGILVNGTHRARRVAARAGLECHAWH
jgi:phosphatidylglycerophosphatase C